MSAEALRDPLALGAPMRFGPGRRAAPLNFALDRELTVDDLLAAQRSEVTQEYKPVKALRQRHHMLARVLSQGVKDEEAGAITGYDPNYVTQLRLYDPAFINLLAYYKEMEKEQYGVARADMHERLASLGFDSIELLHERIEEKPDAFTNKELLAIVEATSDRTGHGKTSTVNHAHEHSVSPETIAAIKLNSGQASALGEADRETLLRLASRGTAVELPEAEEAEWVESGGDGLREESDPAPQDEVLDSDPPLSQVD